MQVLHVPTQKRPCIHVYDFLRASHLQALVARAAASSASVNLPRSPAILSFQPTGMGIEVPRLALLFPSRSVAGSSAQASFKAASSNNGTSADSAPSNHLNVQRKMTSRFRSGAFQCSIFGLTLPFRSQPTQVQLMYPRPRGKSYILLLETTHDESWANNDASVNDYPGNHKHLHTIRPRLLNLGRTSLAYLLNTASPSCTHTHTLRAYAVMFYAILVYRYFLLRSAYHACKLFVHLIPLPISCVRLWSLLCICAQTHRTERAGYSSTFAHTFNPPPPPGMQGVNGLMGRYIQSGKYIKTCCALRPSGV